MIRGTVNARHEPVLPLRLRGPGGAELEVDALVDTGYSGVLILPPATVSALGLSRQISRTIRLGDGTQRQVEVYTVEIEWNGSWLEVLATELDCAPLIGVELLAGHEMFVEFVPGGVVDVTARP